MGLLVPQNLPAGSITQYAGATAPVGWLLMFGQSLAVANYPALFAAIGYAFGGSGANFNVPDARGRVLFGKDNMGGTAANRATIGGGGLDGATLGAAGGGETKTLSAAQMPVHEHPYNGTSGYRHSKPFATSGAAQYTAATGDVDNAGNVAPAGSGGAHSVIPPALVVNYIIKT